ncbi:MAG: Ig-like domain-containing protein [Archangium sp.]
MFNPRPFWLLPLAIALAGCPGPIDTGDGGDENTIVVGPKGGLFLRNGYGIDVPAGAFTEEQRIFVTIIDTGIPDVPMRKRISLGYRLSPSALVPKQPLTLFLPWVNDRLVAGVDPGTYDMRRQLGTEAYTALPGVKTNQMPVPNVEAKTDKLGLFWVTSPAQPNIARLEIDPEEANLRVGDTQQFTGRIVSPTGETIEAPITWSVVPPRVASIDMNGLLTALDPGIATVTARSGMQSTQAKVYVQGTTAGPGTYVHENPFPTGNDLLGGAFAPAGLGTAYAGKNGTVLLEQGTQWQRAFSYPGMDLHAVGGTAIDNAVAIGQVNGGGVLVEFKGASAAPAVRVFPPTQISELNFLWFDGNHGMGVGVGNEVVIRRNGAWTTEYHPSFEALLSVIGDGAGGFTVVGDLGSIYKWDPVRRVWDSLFDTRLAVKLDAAQLINFATGEAWAVGGNRLWHFVGTGWVPEALPGAPPLVKATSLGVFDSRIFVGGSQRLLAPLPSSPGVVLVRSEGTVALDGGFDDAGVELDGGFANAASWASFTLRGQQVPRGIFGAGQQGRVVGDFGAVWKWDSMSASFTETSHGFQGNVADIAVTDTDLFAAVNECNDVRCLARHGTVMHRTATGYEALGTLPTTETVWSIVARGDNEVIVTSDTRVWLWNGTMWSEIPTGGLGGPMLAIEWCGADLWGATATGTVYRGGTTSMQVNSTPAQGPLWSIHCPVAGEIWIAGDQFLASKSGTSSWEQRTSDTVNQAPWQAVWSPGLGEGFAFGDAMFGVYWDTESLVLQDSTGPIGIDVATAMWGNKIDNLYMAGIAKLPGAYGFMLRFDGINWSLVDPGAHRKGTTLTGKSNNEIWLGTEGGGVLKAVPPP